MMRITNLIRVGRAMCDDGRFLRKYVAPDIPIVMDNVSNMSI